MQRKHSSIPSVHWIHSISFLDYRSLHNIKRINKNFHLMGNQAIANHNKEFMAHLQDLQGLLPPELSPLPLSRGLNAVQHYFDFIKNHAQHFYKRLEMLFADFFVLAINRDANFEDIEEHHFLRLLTHAIDNIDHASDCLKQPRLFYTFSDPEAIGKIMILIQLERLEATSRIQLCRLALKQVTHRELNLFKKVLEIGQAHGALTGADYSEALTRIAGTYDATEKFPILLELGANPNAQCRVGGFSEHKESKTESVLATSVRSWSYDSAKILIEWGANADCCDFEALPLIYRVIDSAVYNYGTKNDLVNLLLANGANPNGKSREGCPILVRAAQGGYCWGMQCQFPIIIQALLVNGADAFAEDQHGHDAMYYAKRNRSVEIINILDAHIESLNVAGSVMSVKPR